MLFSIDTLANAIWLYSGYGGRYTHAADWRVKLSEQTTVC